jgi:exodeoxyribonuclease VII large subunit
LPFSDEAMIRAASDCRTPIVSAIGHEPDSPLLDLVADVRASTPTDAAKQVVPDVGEEQRRIALLRDRAKRYLTTRIDRDLDALRSLRARPALATPTHDIDRRAAEVKGLVERARRCVSTALDRSADDVAHLLARVRTLSPAATLERGYAIVHNADGHVVRSSTAVSVGATIAVRLAEGRLAATVASLDKS